MTSLHDRASPTLARLGTHIPALDGLRGLAILLVMVHHFVYFGGMRPSLIIDRIFYAISLAGWCGVDLFFVLSGFLITGILLDVKGSPHFFRNFYMRRLLRIFPLYYGVLLVLFVVLPQFARLGWNFQALVDDQGWYWSYLVNFPIAFEGWPPFDAIAHFWSLAIEEQYYLFWPIIVFLSPPRYLRVICLTVIVCSLGLRVEFMRNGYPLAAYVLTPARMDTLAVGALLALMVRCPGGLSQLSHWAWPVVGATGAMLSGIVLWRRGLDSVDPVVQTIGFTLIAFLFGALLIVAVTSPSSTILGKVFTHRGLMSFGRYSYALYVFHHPLGYISRRSGFRVANLPTFLGSQLPGELLYIAVATGLSLGLALLSWHLYEAQFLKLKPLFPYQSNVKTTRVA
jgi:peptidoglycan/LPS O-acetylase OafA/YrhL